MTSLEVLLAALGWCTLMNLGMLTVTTLLLVVWGEAIGRLHQRWFRLEKRELQREYFRYLANYKLLLLVFNLVPYLALRLAMR
ncbi:hypothetical protein Enr13x_75570 [Stieleria neptunia]|uniref:DUF6868 domain-containing protein n=1 Tax=Stieleria neptunia TaxID=2527979 RepID=A0A518I3K4_9BACT|nr:hypothetical protein [Stieleria neptunia]QDV47646.1 hypothetical protein Enr13x_75570 [Stieleria neptunia]